MQLINSVSNMTDGVECFMDTDVTTYLASSDEVMANGSRFTVTEPVHTELDKTHQCWVCIRVEDNLDGSFIITVVEA